jgi:Replication initiator protein, pSAM2
VLAGVIRAVARNVWFATVSHPARPKGWDITWGTQVDPRVVRLTDDGEITDIAVASYLAKYATKSTEPVGVPPGRITADTASVYAKPRTHQERLIAACLRLGGHTHQDFRALRRWAHMLGYRGHFATKSRRYSTTMRALRAARRNWQRRQHPVARHQGDKSVLTFTDLQWAGRGWRTTGDALLALSAAARAREHRRIAREEMVVA